MSILFLYNIIKLIKLNLQISCAKEKQIMRKCNATLRKVNADFYTASRNSLKNGTCFSLLIIHLAYFI